MKKRLLLIVLLFCGAGHFLSAAIKAQGRVLDKKISLDLDNKSLKEVFDQMTRDASVSFIYSNALELANSSVSIHVRNVPVGQVLSRILAPFPLTYKLIGDQIVITVDEKKRQGPDAGPKEKTAIQKQVTGKVTDVKGNPLPGATVRVEGGKMATVTNEEGRFVLPDVPVNSVLQISYVGFRSQELKLGDNMDNLLIVLDVDENKLNEVQLIGYGETTKRLNTGSVVTIHAEDIGSQPVADPIAALQGRASGVSIQTQNGLPGGNMIVQIRGQGSIASGTAPLYIVDGVPFLSAPISSNQSANGVINPLSSLNPGDIASISILKDADATAIYGSRGANGVVLITTKKGTSGKTAFEADVNQGFSQISRYTQLLSLPEYLAMRKEAYQNDGLTPTAAKAPDLLVWSQTQSTDWQKYLFGRRAAMTSIQTSLTGGDAGTRFLFSTNYRNEGSILPGDENYKKGGGYLNLEHTSANKKFTADLSVTYELDDNHTLYNALTSLAYLPPNYPMYNPDGSYYFGTGNNPAPLLGQRSHIQSANLIVNGLWQYELAKGLKLKASLGYTKYAIDQLATVPAATQNNLFGVPLDLAYQTHNSSASYLMEPQMDYSLRIGQGTFSALAGATLQDRVDQGDVLTETGVNNAGLLGNIGAAGTITGVNNYTDYRYVSLFGRLNYEWQQKYILDLNFRRDGSSRFGDQKQFGNFGAAGAAWIFSDENLVRDGLPFLSFGKLRTSYGITGNDQIADYQYLTAYSSGAIYGGTTSLAPSRIANPDYSWETTYQLEAALELGFFKDRITLASAWYRRRSDNQLVTYPLPFQSGFSGYQANLPALVQNTGWEFDLNTVNIKTKAVSWTSTFNLTLPKNVLLSFPHIAASSYANTLVVGQDLSVVKGYYFTRVDPKTGLAQFRDVNQDGIVGFPQDVVVLGKNSPVWFGGFGNTVSYRHFQMTVFLEGRRQRSAGYPPSFGASLLNNPVAILGRWQHPGDQTAIPRYTTLFSNLGNGNFNSSNAVFGDASYVRVKNVSLSYDFNPRMVQKLHLQRLRFFLEGQNILTFANPDRFDPEIPGGTGSIPPLKTWVAGLKITL